MFDSDFYRSFQVLAKGSQYVSIRIKKSWEYIFLSILMLKQEPRKSE